MRYVSAIRIGTESLRAPARRKRAFFPPGFTLIELLVVVVIIALLMAILLPSLQRARQQSRLVVCLSNVRSQGASVLLYATEFQGGLPPQKTVVFTAGGDTVFDLINSFLAKYEHRPFPPSGGNFPRPTGIWRCPDVTDFQDATIYTHSGLMHHSPNRYLFNFVQVYEEDAETDVTSAAYFGWESRYGTSQWRKLERIRRPEQIIALMDNVSFYNVPHGHREWRENYGTACDACTYPNDCNVENEGSHDQLGKRPAVMVDGHAEPIPSLPSYWLNLQTTYRYRGDAAAQPATLHAREVERLMWFIEPADYIGP